MGKTSAFVKTPTTDYENYDFGLSKYGIGANAGTNAGVSAGNQPVVPEAPGVSLTHNQYINQLEGQKRKLQDQLKDANNSFKWDGDTMGGIAGLGSVALELAALPDQLKMARLQQKALKQNIATAKQEQDRRNSNIASFNSYQPPASVKPSQPTSAFAGGN